MKNSKQIISLVIIQLLITSTNFAQTKLRFGKQEFELHNVTGSVIKFQGENVLKIERDLHSLPFDANRLEATVDEKHYAKLVGIVYRPLNFWTKRVKNLRQFRLFLLLFELKYFG